MAGRSNRRAAFSSNYHATLADHKPGCALDYPSSGATVALDADVLRHPAGAAELPVAGLEHDAQWGRPAINCGAGGAGSGRARHGDDERSSVRTGGCGCDCALADQIALAGAIAAFRLAKPVAPGHPADVGLW